MSKKQITLGDVTLPHAVLNSHMAALGKTGSGKTSTAKLFIEHIAETGGRVCVLDPIKSDWWGLTSSANGKKASLPFQILGGPYGHVPLHPTAGKVIAELVGRGRLPLSILDMADFPPGCLQQFFIDFAELLLKKMRGVVHLVMEEAHLFAPKELSGVGREHMAIHWAKLMATAGRSKGIRLVLVTQRTQSLHNALLGSCETLIAHRLVAPADQAPVEKWLAANAPREVIPEIKQSLGKLKTGEAWVCSGDASLFERVQFPKIKTFDNTKAPTGTGRGGIRVKTAAVDTEKLSSLIGEADEEFKANDPKLLKEKIAQLERENRSLAKAKQPPATVTKGLTDAQARALVKAETDKREREWREYKAKVEAELKKAHGDLGRIAAIIGGPALPVSVAPKAPGALKVELVPYGTNSSPKVELVPYGTNSSPQRTQRAQRPALSATQKPAMPGPPAEGLSKAQQRIVDALAWFESVGIMRPSRANVAAIAGASSKSSSYMNNISRLSSLEHIEYPDRGCLALTESGRSIANAPALPATLEDLHQEWLTALSPAEGRILSVVIESHGKELSRDELAERSGASAASSSYMNNVSHLSSLGLVKYPRKGFVTANEDTLFPDGLA